MSTKQPPNLNRTGRRDTKPRLTLDRVRKALIKHNGIQAHAAESLGMSHRSIMSAWVKRHPELRDVIAEATVEGLDVARDNIYDLMNNSDDRVKLSASAKYIDVYGGAHGLGVQHHRHAGPNGGPIQFDMSIFTDEQLAQLEAIQSTLAAAARGDKG